MKIAIIMLAFSFVFLSCTARDDSPVGVEEREFSQFQEFKYFLITRPIDQSEYRQGDRIKIEWKSFADIETVVIEFYRKAKFLESVAETPSSRGEYFWTLPTNLEYKFHYRFKLTNANNPEEFAFSEYFNVYQN